MEFLETVVVQRDSLMDIHLRYLHHLELRMRSHLFHHHHCLILYNHPNNYHQMDNHHPINLQNYHKHYPLHSSRNCCGKFYGRADFYRLVASHFKTKKHYNSCLKIADEKFKTDFKEVSDINRDFEEKCKENRYLKQMIFELREENKNLRISLTKFQIPVCRNLIDI